MIGDNYEERKRTKEYPELREGTQKRTNFENGSLPKTKVEMSLAGVWLQPTRAQRSSQELVHGSRAAVNNPLGAG